ncbi:MAG: hypothetical protein AAGL49_00945 [Pseudomonadota bacterium]
MNWRLIVRWGLAGPGALLAATVTLAATPTWAPSGEAGINNYVVPLVLFPAYWAAAFFYIVLEENLTRAAIIVACFLALNGLLIYGSFAGA